MDTALLKSKLKAFGIHISLSMVIFIALLAMLRFVWYPGVWFSVDGGWQGTRIMVLVDLVLGPLLTLLIFNPSKSRRETLLDFSVIGLIQVAALSWGTYAVHKQRPLAIVFWNTAFYSIDQDVLDKTGKSALDLAHLGDTLPVLVYSPPAQSAQEEIEMLMDELNDNLMQAENTERYQPLKDHMEAVSKAALASDGNAQLESATQRLLKELPELKRGELLFLPFHGRYGNYLLAMNRSGEILDTLPEEASAAP